MRAHVRVTISLPDGRDLTAELPKRNPGAQALMLIAIPSWVAPASADYERERRRWP
jgi:hypothetical protein